MVYNEGGTKLYCEHKPNSSMWLKNVMLIITHVYFVPILNYGPYLIPLNITMFNQEERKEKEKNLSVFKTLTCHVHSPLPAHVHVVMGGGVWFNAHKGRDIPSASPKAFANIL